jgi:hypothetical protein
MNPYQVAASKTTFTDRAERIREDSNLYDKTTLIFTPSSLTKFGKNGAYSFSQNIPLSGDLATVSTTLLTWLNQQLVSGEAVSQIVLESGGSVAATFTESTDEEGNVSIIPVTFRNLLNAAVSVTAEQGERTFSLSSESLPPNLRDSLLSTWASLDA